MSMPDTLYRPNPDVIATTLEDSESVLLDVKTRRYYSLNETGTRIWELLTDGQAVSGKAGEPPVAKIVGGAGLPRNTER